MTHSFGSHPSWWRGRGSRNLKSSLHFTSTVRAESHRLRHTMSVLSSLPLLLMQSRIPCLENGNTHLSKYKQYNPCGHSHRPILSGQALLEAHFLSDSVCQVLCDEKWLENHLPDGIALQSLIVLTHVHLS